MKHPSASTGDNSSPQETATHFSCPICSLGLSFSSGLKRQLVGHKRNSTAHLVHLINATGFKGRNYAAQCNSQIGLSQHRRRAHPAEYNDEKLASRLQSQYNWSKLEDAKLVSTASGIVCQTYVNISE
ncbi:hypothetical protein EG68_09258 [Paragonimus skrjabini miyazakii]|uniref:Uncharacterized protein n=1 Tax=Paragonimus skrjabini miyazakii TaxID=59628 RepID=A0A8S9YQI2_9TREM|nr:hypothetical protein EG68_09258 [Paragonimus skrjabini miyazakii]